MSSVQTIAKILRTDATSLAEVEKRLWAASGESGVFDKILEENESLIREKMLELGVSRDAGSHEVYDALISKIEADDYLIFQGLGSPDFMKAKECQRIADVAKRTIKPPPGFFLKLEKARELLAKEPPRSVMSFLGYDSVSAMLEKEDLLEVYSALRFIEGSDWLNSVFFKQYEELTPADFEEREIVVKALGEKWAKESQKFVVKKKHNISHLKELGVVFVIPTLLGISGEVLRMFALIMHYLYEVPFYASLFRDVSRDPQLFPQNLVSLLRGDVWESRFPPTDRIWLVVQRYLAKEDPHDWRLFVPHINPEAIHWAKAEESLTHVGEELDGFSKQLFFWHDLGWVGDYFKDEAGIDVLVSFNLVDTVMSLVKQREMVKYLYHHQEALWNRIFAGHFGGEKLEEYSRKYLLKGYFQI